MKYFLILAALSTPALAASHITMECKLTKPLKEALPVGMHKLKSVKSFTFKMNLMPPTAEANLKGTAYNGDEKKDMPLDQNFSAELKPGQVLDLETASGPFNLYFDRVLFTIAQVDGPASAGPPHPGTYPAKANVVLMSRSADAGKQRVHVANLDLDCQHTTVYPQPPGAGGGEPAPSSQSGE